MGALKVNKSSETLLTVLIFLNACCIQLNGRKEELITFETKDSVTNTKREKKFRNA